SAQHDQSGHGETLNERGRLGIPYPAPRLRATAQTRSAAGSRLPIRPHGTITLRMPRKLSVLITGASGGIGHGLITRLAALDPDRPVITLDLNPLTPELAPKVRHQFGGSILDRELLDRILAEYEVDQVYHLAALLSTRSEFSPALAHKVNVEGTLNML